MSEHEPQQQEKTIDKEARLVSSLTDNELEQLYCLLKNSQKNLDTTRNIFRKAAEAMKTATGNLRLIYEGLITEEFTPKNLERTHGAIYTAREEKDINKLPKATLDFIAKDAARFMKEIEKEID